MATFKTLEIDTLRLRNLLVTTKENALIPADFHLYSKGDGTTFWSTGVTAIQFINLSTTVSTLISTNTSEHSQINSTLLNTNKNLQKELFSTLFGFSTFATNLSTYAVSLKYTDDKINTFSTQLTSYLANTYQTKEAARDLNAILLNLIISKTTYLENQVTTANSNVDSLIFDTSNKFDIQNATLANLSSIATSTFSELFLRDELTKSQLQTSIVNNTNYVQNNINTLSTNIGAKLTEVNITQINQNINNSAANLLNAININGNNTYLSSVKYTDQQISTLSSNTYTNLSIKSAYLTQLINDRTNTLTTQMTLQNTLQTDNLSTAVGKQSTINKLIVEDLATLVNTGLTKKIYQTFIELEAYSAGVVQSTVVSANQQFLSTISSFSFQYTSTLNMINKSSFNYLVDTAYFSSLSTLLPQVETTLTATILKNINDFTSSTVGLESSFALTISTLNISNIVSVNTFFKENSTIQGIEINKVVLKIETVIQDTVSRLQLGEISTLFNIQYKTAPSIIVNSTDNLVTLNNVKNVTGLQSLTASIINLDLTTYENFYVLVSDISSDVFYGLTYTTGPEVVSKDINLHIDITSSYTNKFQTIDTASLSNWLHKPKIYNQGPYGLYDKMIPQIYLSTFIGAHIVQMRLDRNILYVKDIINIPYIYTNMKIEYLNTDNKITVNDPALLTSSFFYSNAEIGINWQTNDLNVKVGIKFEGQDVTGKQIEKWSGPYISGDGTAKIKVPGHTSLVQYSKLYLSIYPEKGYELSPASGNIPGSNQVFDTYALESPIIVYTPTSNSRVTIYNPGTVEKILEVSELQIYNMNGINIVGEDYATYVRLTSTSSYPYQGDFATWKADNIFDGSQTTSFRGGQDVNTIDQNAYISCDLTALKTTITANELISSIVIYGSENNDSLFSIDGLLIKIENKNQLGIVDGLFSKIVTLNGRTPNVIRMS